MRNNLGLLMAHKASRERRRITTNVVAAELKDRVSRNSLYAFASDKMTEYPKGMLEALMNYFDCDLADLFIVEQQEDTQPR